MDEAGRRAFLLLVVAQALHSVEEYAFALWEVLAPAQFISQLVSRSDPAFGFAVVNTSIVALACLSYAVPIRRNLRSALPVAWFWTLLEGLNGIGHVAFAVAAGGYFPGLFTAPLLLACSAVLAARLARTGEVA